MSKTRPRISQNKSRPGKLFPTFYQLSLVLDLILDCFGADFDQFWNYH